MRNYADSWKSNLKQFVVFIFLVLIGYFTQKFSEDFDDFVMMFVWLGGLTLMTVATVGAIRSFFFAVLGIVADLTRWHGQSIAEEMARWQIQVVVNQPEEE